ncbi:MAG: chemotaxis protein CheW [Gammaproteobacteria bacterium CG22_combo_CG10-13_8_21_14_all_40_8]|nr:MAG: chemotaxis protein CheW [Gammaproteobacteria bacterium CG22_combo_CG10-13_8_21_14_all_40_8]
MSNVQEISGYELLQQLDQKCRDLAFPLPNLEEKAELWSGMGFLLNGKSYLVPLTEVAEILHMPVSTRVPGAKSWVKGVANVRGTLLPIMDLTDYLFKKANKNRKQRLLVIQKNELISSVTVDDILGLQHFEDFERLEEISELEEAVRPFVKGAFSRNNQIWTIFSLHTLAEDPSFLQVAI